MAVKPHQAFFLAARTDHATGLVPIPRHIPALFQSILSPTRGSLGRAVEAKAILVGGRAFRSGRQARTTVYPCGTCHSPKHLVPYTRRASGTPS
jgi:hypothetical protein